MRPRLRLPQSLSVIRLKHPHLRVRSGRLLQRTTGNRQCWLSISADVNCVKGKSRHGGFHRGQARRDPLRAGRLVRDADRHAPDPEQRRDPPGARPRPMTEILAKFRTLGGAARLVERAVDRAGRHRVGVGAPAPASLSARDLQRAVSRAVPGAGAGAGAGLPRVPRLAPRAQRSRALVRLGADRGRARRRRLRDDLLPDHRLLARRGLVGQGHPRWDGAGPRARGRAAARGLGAHVDRGRLRPLREVRLAPARPLLRQGLVVEPHRGLPLPRHQTESSACR